MALTSYDSVTASIMTRLWALDTGFPFPAGAGKEFFVLDTAS